ncbi:LuxR C-terminal-related transcriptional regulator [Leisingera thetidis]|uniref:LuxR C-terminal-related transcriptional regulator n=1 Tax=Leisingera thetidis TaxID=2930199 RepID=UPI0021F7D293|nr:LuxR C-terminal-related transcriptional regulator [Leisingera thetidis]
MFEVPREDLLKPFARTPAASLITIEAPAGSGKTTLLRQLREQLSCRGLRQVHVQPGADTDEPDLLQNLLDAIGVSGLSAELELPHRDDAFETFTDRFVQELTSLAGHTFVIVDDFHRYKSASAIKLLTTLAHLEPRPPVTIVVASRAACDIPVSALRLRGRLVELDQRSLKFSEREANALREMAGTGLDKAIWTAFWKKVDGWAVALQLALILLRERKIGISDLLNFSGTQREMASYLSQLIVDGASEQDRALLYTAAAFDSLRPDVTGAVLGRARADRLHDLIATLALPTEIAGKQPGEIRLHGVVSEFLKARAQSKRVDMRALQANAAAFLESSGEWRKAIRYGLSTGDLALAAGIAERGGGWRLVYRGEEGTPRQFRDLAKMPRELYGNYPRTVLGLSVSAAKRGEIDLALDLLEKIAAVADPADLALAAELRLISALMDLYSDRQTSPEAIEQLEKDISKDTEVDAVRLALTQNLLCFCSLQAANFKAAIHYGRLSVAAFRDARSDFGAAHLPLHIGQAEFFGGQMDNARATLQQHSEHCVEELGATADLTLMTQALLSETIIEQGANPPDRAFLREAFIRLGKRDSWFDPLASLLVSQIRLALADGDSTEAEVILSQAEDIAHRRHYHRLLGLVRQLRIEILLKSGQTKDAEQLLGLAAGTKVSSPAYDPVNLRGSPSEALQARLLLDKGAFGEALPLLDALLADPAAARNAQRSIRLSLQKIRTLVAMEDTGKARADLERLALTHRVDLYRLPFVEEGPVLARFMSEHIAGLDPQSLIHRRLAPPSDLIACHYPGARAAPSELVHLTGTEAQVISLLEKGKTNKEIARDLSVTVNTVKFHLSNIFRKLGVSTRTAAITTCREQGLLSAAFGRS